MVKNEFLTQLKAKIGIKLFISNKRKVHYNFRNQTLMKVQCLGRTVDDRIRALWMEKKSFCNRRKKRNCGLVGSSQFSQRWIRSPWK